MKLTVEQRKLHELAINTGVSHRESCARIIEVLMDVERERLYKLVDCSSLFMYAVKFMGLDEDDAYRAMNVARRALQFPRLRKSIVENKLTIPKANRIVSTLTARNSEHLVEFAEKHSTNAINREVRRLRADAGLQEEMKKIEVSSKTLEKIKRVRALMAAKSDLDGALNAVLDEWLDRHDPVLKAKRAVERAAKVKSTENEVQAPPAPLKVTMGEKNTWNFCINRTRKKVFTAKKGLQPKRVRLTAAEKHAVFARDGGRCTHRDRNESRCSNDRYLQIHHIIPVSVGGTNEPDNLTTLCAFHHDLVHQMNFPIDGQVSWLR